jgi:hypothetical protein
MSRNARTFSDSKSLKDGMSPEMKCQKRVCASRECIPLTILQKIQADIFGNEVTASRNLGVKVV